MARGVGDGDDREARLDRLAVGQPHLGRRRVHRPARDRARPQQRRVRPGGGRQRECRADRRREDARPPHASVRPLRQQGRERRARRRSTPTTSATIVSSRRRRRRRATRRPRSAARACPSPRTGPVDDLAVEYVWRTCDRVRLARVEARAEAEDGVLVGRHVAAAPGHLLDHLLLARAGRLASRFQPGDGSNESIEKPSGTVSSTCSRRRVLLLGRHSERELLDDLRFGHGRAEGRVRERRLGEHERAQLPPRRWPRPVSFVLLSRRWKAGYAGSGGARGRARRRAGRETGASWKRERRPAEASRRADACGAARTTARIQASTCAAAAASAAATSAERGEDRKRVAVHGADQAGEPVAAEARHASAGTTRRGRRRASSRRRARRSAAASRRNRSRGATRSGRRRARSRTPRAASQTVKTESAAPSATRDERHDDEPRPAGRGLEPPRERARRGERVAEPARREHEHGDDREPERAALIAPSA